MLKNCLGIFKRGIIAVIIMLPHYLGAQSNGYSFFVAGHSYGEPETNNKGLHPPFQAKFKYINSISNIKLGILTGDIVSKKPIEQDWIEVDSVLEGLNFPVYFAVGNHDMENRPIYETRYGKTYFHKIINNDLFIILDPNLDHWNISGNQLKYLKEVISENAKNVDNVFVFFHQILWIADKVEFEHVKWNSVNGKASKINFWTELEPIFQQIDNRVTMFAGDVGVSWASDVSYDNFNNITYITSGMGDKNGENFVVVNVDSNKFLSYDIICLSSTELNCLGKMSDHQIVVFEEDKSIGESKIFPNPTENYVIIELKRKIETSVKIVDIIGRVVFDGLISENKIVVDTRGFRKGIYLIITENEFNITQSKLIIE